jgi:hypothetical protein
LYQLNQKKIENSMLQKGCDWIFTPPKASHRGGIWERMIRSIRKILRSLLGDQLVTDEVLTTLITEVEHIMNSRPLTKLSDDANDLEALTPNHLLLLKGNNPVVADKPTGNLTRRWKQVQHLADTFWKRWLTEYLPALQERQKWFSKGRDLRVGDLVLLTDMGASRGLWPKAIIQETVNSQDGKVRTVWVKTATGRLKRDIRQLCLLEEAGTLNQEINAGECK